MRAGPDTPRRPLAARLALTVGLLCLTARCTAQQSICGYQATVQAFESTSSVVVNGVGGITMTSLGVASPAETAPTSLDITSPACIVRSCPIYLHGTFLTALTAASADSSETDVFCFFGNDLDCVGVLSLRNDELVCNSPVLPTTFTIAPFGVLVLQPGAQGPGTLYLPAGLEINFFHSGEAPLLTAIEPPFSDILEFPETFRVFGYNLSPGRQGSNSLVCKWNNEDAVEAEYIQQDQTLGDDISHIECPAPRFPLAPGATARVRVSLGGCAPHSMYGGGGRLQGRCAVGRAVPRR